MGDGGGDKWQGCYSGGCRRSTLSEEVEVVMVRGCRGWRRSETRTVGGWRLLWVAVAGV
ncbi:hypothetical protein SESBI_14149 [Sesbania bispinosa]|nr:hypothetical protein SESBI_14149 [Sesbania bispinosa]